MKCLDCGNREYELAYHGGYWLCRECDDELSLAAYEKIEAMEKVIVKLLITHEWARECLKISDMPDNVVAALFAVQVTRNANCTGPQPCGSCPSCEEAKQ